MSIKYLRETEKRKLKGTALLRLDFNTKDDWRMRAVLPTLKFLLKTSDKIVVVSHFGRPTPGKFEKEFSLKKDSLTLAKLLGRKVTFVDIFDLSVAKLKIAAAPKGSVFLVENLRFIKGEEENSPAFAKQLAALADFYVNDAFAVSHRANASVAAITKLLPSYAGFELEREIRSLGAAMIRPKRPLIFILGGAKASDKLGIVAYFRRQTDWFLLGGGPANTILWLKGVNVKKSVRDTEPKDLKKIKALTRYKNIQLPVDFRWSDDAILDLGPKTVKIFTKKIAAARTILWSGPLGYFEKPSFAKGGVLIARAIAKNRKAFSVAGGGETVMFLKKYGLDKKFSFISTGGGAMVDFLAGKKLPGIEALK